MAIAVTSTREDLAQRYGEVALYLSAHTGDPGTTGANEVTGGSPAYARQLVTWNDGGEDGVITGDPVDIDVPAGTTITHVGLWTAATGGTFKDKTATSPNPDFSNQGVLRVTPTFTQT